MPESGRSYPINALLGWILVVSAMIIFLIGVLMGNRWALLLGMVCFSAGFLLFVLETNRKHAEFRDQLAEHDILLQDKMNKLFQEALEQQHALRKTEFVDPAEPKKEPDNSNPTQESSEDR